MYIEERGASVKKVSRKKTRAAIVLLILSVTSLIIGVLVQSTTVYLCGAAALAVFTAVMLRTNRCPACGAFFRGLCWSAPDAGYCRECGALIEYDDYEDIDLKKL